MIGRTTDGTDPYVPGHGDDSFDVDHYDLDLAYKPLGNRLDGEAALTCTARADLSAIHLDLHHLRVAKVWVDGKPVRWSHRAGRVRVSTAKRAGTRFSVRLRYQGSPRTIASRTLGDAGWEELTDGVIVAAQPHGAPSWFPCNDRPDNKATYRCQITVPAGYLAVFSGEERDSSRGSSTVTAGYEQPAPMASYLATLQIGRYQRHKQKAPVPMSLVLPDGLRPGELGDSFGLQPDMMKVFVKRFGPYPFASYTSVVTDDSLEIPLESQGLSTFGRNFCRPQWETVRLIAHELSHQWFGNAVTARSWNDIWLHEGFACYAEWIYSPHAGQRSTGEWADHYYDRLSALPEDLLLSDPGPADMFDDRVYKRGALLLHALRFQVGDDAFFTILKRWVAEHTGTNVSTADFLALCEDVNASSLQELFAAWLDQTALPAAPWRSGKQTRAAR